MAEILKDRNDKPIMRDGQEVYASYFSDGVNQVKGVDMKSRRLTIVGTDETRDRQGDIITLKGWQLDNFLKNPVFLWAHDYGSIPIGGAEKVVKRRSPSRLVFVEKFWPEGLFSFSDLILEGYNHKIINASSVGFIPKKSELIDEEGAGEGTFWDRTPKRFLEQELLELSGCPVPCNPSALQEAFGTKEFGGIKFEHWTRYLSDGEVPESKHADDIKEEIEKLRKNVEFIDEDKKTQVVVDGFKAEEGDEVLQTVKSEKRPPLKRREFPKEEPEGKDRVLVGPDGEVIAECKDEEWITTPGYNFEFVEDEDKKVGGSRSLSIADEGHAWDASGAKSRIAKWASSDGSGDKDKVSWTKYKRAFGYYDPDKSEEFGGYKLPFADVIDNSLKAVWKGCAAVVAALNGARGGVDIPDTDRKGVYNLMKVYYKKFDKPIPDLRSFYDLAKFMEEVKEVFGTNGEINPLKTSEKSIEVKKGQDLYKNVLALPSPADKGKSDAGSQKPQVSEVDARVIADMNKELKRVTEAVAEVKKKMNGR